VTNNTTNQFVNNFVNCTLISSKKEQYYKFTTKNIKQMLPNHNNEIDYNVYSNCCNCISLVLYTKSYVCTDKFGSVLRYLSSINQTIKNVGKYLPDYLIRLYLDPSIYRTLVNDYKKNLPIIKSCKSLIQGLFKYENIEIYTISCEDTNYTHEIYFEINNSGFITPDSRTRAYRTLILKDPSINICIMRDADGVVSKLDCYNIKKFEESDKLFYLPSLNDTIPIVPKK
jgi:hypothetical protein